MLLPQTVLLILGDDYIDYIYQLSGEACDRSAIIAKKDGSILAHTLDLGGFEAKIIATAFRNNDFQTFKDNGIWVEGIKYMYLR